MDEKREKSLKKLSIKQAWTSCRRSRCTDRVFILVTGQRISAANSSARAKECYSDFSILHQNESSTLYFSLSLSHSLHSCMCSSHPREVVGVRMEWEGGRATSTCYSLKDPSPKKRLRQQCSFTLLLDPTQACFPRNEKISQEQRK